MTEQQMKKVLRQIMDICQKLEREGCPANEVADGVRAIYTLVARCVP